MASAMLELTVLNMAWAACSTVIFRPSAILLMAVRARSILQLYLPAAEIVRVDIAKDDCGVGDGGLGPAEVVAGGPGVGRGALGPHPEQTQRIQPAYAATTGSDTHYIGHLDPEAVVAEPLPDLQADLPVLHQAGVPGGPAHIADEEVVLADRLTQIDRAGGSGRRTRPGEINRLRDDGRNGLDELVGLHDQKLVLETRLLSVSSRAWSDSFFTIGPTLALITQVLSLSYSPIFGRSRLEHETKTPSSACLQISAALISFAELAYELMKHMATASTCCFLICSMTLEQFLFVDRDGDLTGSFGLLLDCEPQIARDDRLVRRNVCVVHGLRLDLERTAHLDDVSETLRGDQRRPGQLPLHQRVRSTRSSRALSTLSASGSPSERCRKSAAASTIVFMTPSEKSHGVVGDLNSWRLPSPSRTMQSVKVPPVSTHILNIWTSSSREVSECLLLRPFGSSGKLSCNSGIPRSWSTRLRSLNRYDARRSRSVFVRTEKIRLSVSL